MCTDLGKAETDYVDGSVGQSENLWLLKKPNFLNMAFLKFFHIKFNQSDFNKKDFK